MRSDPSRFSQAQILIAALFAVVLTGESQLLQSTSTVRSPSHTPPTGDKAIGARIRNLRNSLRLSQEDFGRKIGASGSTVCCWEKGRLMPSSIALKAIESLGGPAWLDLPAVCDPRDQASIADRVRNTRRSLGMTQGAFGKAIGVSQHQVSKLEGGEVRPYLKTLAAIEHLERTKAGAA